MQWKAAAPHLEVVPLPDLVDVVGALRGGEAGAVVADHVLDGVTGLELLSARLAVHPRCHLEVVIFIHQHRELSIVN